MTEANYTFRGIYEDVEGFKLFSKFLKDSFSLEQANFLEQVEDYKLLYTHHNRKEKAKKIIERFVKIGSQEELNLTGGNREKLLNKYEENVKNDFYEKDLFEIGKGQVIQDIMVDAFVRFVRTEEFLDFEKKQTQALGEEEFKKKFYKKNEEMKEEENTQKVEKQLFPEKLKNLKPTVQLPFTKEEAEKVSNGLKKSIDIEGLNIMVVEMLKPGTGVEITAEEDYQRKSSSPLSPVSPSLTKKNSLFSMISNIGKKAPKKETSVSKQPQKYQRTSVGLDIYNWVMKHLKTENKEVVQFVIDLFLKYEVFKPIAPNQKFDVEELYIHNIKKKIIVIGAGFAGLCFSKIMAGDFDVTLIDAKPNFELNISFHKLLATPEYYKKLILPIEKIAKGARVIQSYVHHISPSAVYLPNEVLPFDYLVIATGSHYTIPFPVKVKPTNIYQSNPDKVLDLEVEEKDCHVFIPYESSQILAAYPKILNARHIVVIGSGPVGIEVLGQIGGRGDYKLTLITQAASTLERISNSAHIATIKTMKDWKNLEILYNTVVTRVEGKNIYFKSTESQDLVKNVEKSFECDVVICCVGLKPTTGIFKKYMSDSLNKKGFVKVNEFFQVKNNQNALSIKKFTEEVVKSQIEEEEEFIKSQNLIKKESFQDVAVEETNYNVGELFSQFPSFEQKIDTKKDTDSYSNIFALGDILDIKDEKLAYFAMEHAKRCCQNIKSLELETSKKPFAEKVYVAGNESIQLIEIGSKCIMFKGTKMLNYGSNVLHVKNAVEASVLQFFSS